jgi:hypothetical protein
VPPIDAALLATVLADLAGQVAHLLPAAEPLPGHAATAPAHSITAAPAGSRTPALAGAAAFAVLTVALTVWLHRKIRPELLTPANARPNDTEPPPQPGGAPSA